MTWHVPVNFAESTVFDGELNNTTSPVTFSVEDAASFGSSFPIYATVDPDGTPEIIEITFRSGNALTATRSAPVLHEGAPTLICAVASQYITEIQSAIDAKAAIVSPSLTGTPTSVTPPANNNSTMIATTAYVDSAVSQVGQSFPASGNLSMGGFRLTNLGAPTSSSDACTKAYADSISSGGGGGGGGQHAILMATSSQNCPGGMFTQLNFDSVVEDSSAFTSTANRFTVPSDGIYLATLSVGFSGASNNRLQIGITSNGLMGSNLASALTFAQSKDDRDTSEYWPLSCAGIASLSSGDSVFATAYAAGGGESTSNTGLLDFPYAYFTIVKIG